MKSVIKAEKEKQISAIDKRLYSHLLSIWEEPFIMVSTSRDMRLPMIWVSSGCS